MTKGWVKRTISILLCTAMLTGPVTAVAQGGETAGAGNQNYFTNRGELNETAFVSLPMGAVTAKDWLLQQLYYQKVGLTGNIQDNYDIYGPNNGWRGGNGDNWEKGPYFLRGLVSLAWTLDDADLKSQAMEWLDFILESGQSTGYFGPKAHGDGTGTGWDWWPHMVVIQTLRDYYEATEWEGNPDSRVLPLLENYFRFQLQQLSTHKLNSWAASRGGDNIEVVLWYYNRVYDPQNPEDSLWLIDLAKLLESQTRSQNSGKTWTDIFTNTTSREHVVNTTQAMKTPAVIWQFTGLEEDRNALREGLRNMGIDHGRIDNLANSDEGARDNYPYRGSETCSVVESLLSNEIALEILGEGWIGDEIESLAYNNLPACYTSDFTGHVYFQAQNQVMGTHGWHEFDSDHGDDLAFGAPCGFECCFPNMHMGWPKFVSSMYMATTDGGLAVIAYGPNEVEALVADGQTARFTQDTDYPFKDTVTLTYSGDTAAFPLRLRVPSWCDNPTFRVNSQAVTGDIADGFFTLSRTWKAGDTVTVQFPMEVRVSDWYNDSVAVQYGALTLSLKVEEDWRPITDLSARTDKRQPAQGYENREVYPASDWNFGLVYDPDDLASSFTVEVADEIPLQPFSLSTNPLTVKAVGQSIPQWQLKGNVVPEPPYSPVAPDTSLQREIELVPYGATRLRITQMPTVGETPADLCTVRTAAHAKVYTQDGKQVTEFDNVNVRQADNYTLEVSYVGTGDVTVNINSKYSRMYSLNGEPLVLEDLINLVPTASPTSTNWFRFGYGKYNNIRFIGTGDVEITQIRVVPVKPFTAPVIRSVTADDDVSSITVNTNIPRAAGFYSLEYGTESGVYTYTASNFYGTTATLTGLTGSDVYYLRVSMLCNGTIVTSKEVKVTAGTAGETPDFADDFSNPAGSREQWTVMDPNGAVSFAQGSMSVGASNNVKVITGEQGWTDYTVVTHIKGTGNAANRNFGVMVRTTGAKDGADGYNGYYVGIRCSGGLVVGWADGGWHEAATVSGFTFESGRLYELKVVVAGERLVAYVDGVKLYDGQMDEMKNGNKTAPVYQSGGAGLRSWNQPFTAEDFLVRELNEEETLLLPTPKPEEPETETPADPPVEAPSFTDTFDSADTSSGNWSFIGESGKIGVADGKLVFGTSNNVKAVTGEETWTDYAVEAIVTLTETTTQNAGIMYRVTGAGSGADKYNGYYFGIGNDAAGNGFIIRGWADGGWHEGRKISTATPFAVGTPYRLKVVTDGNRFTLYVNDRPVEAYTDDRYTAGQIGLRSFKQAFTVDDVTVRAATEEELGDVEIPVEVKEGIGAYKTVQLFFPNFSESRQYKIVYGTKPGEYTHTVSALTAGRYAGEKLAFSVPENGVAYYVRAIEMNGSAEGNCTDEVAVTAGYRLDVSDRLEALETSLRAAEEQDTAGCTDESVSRLAWAKELAASVLANPNSNLMDVALAESSLTVGTQTLQKETSAVLKGDVTLDGSVNASDMTALARHVAGIEPLTGEALRLGCLTGGTEPSAEDLTKLARFVAGIERNLE